MWIHWDFLVQARANMAFGRIWAAPFRFPWLEGPTLRMEGPTQLIQHPPPRCWLLTPNGDGRTTAKKDLQKSLRIFFANRRTARWTGLQGCDSDPFRAKKNQTHTHLTPFLSIIGVPTPVVFEVVDDYHFATEADQSGSVSWGNVEICAGFRAKPSFGSGGHVDKTTSTFKGVPNGS